MRRKLRILSILAFSFVCAACQIKPVQYAGTPAPQPRCSEIRTRIAIDPPVKALGGEAELIESRDPLSRAILESYRRAASSPLMRKQDETDRGPVSDSMLFLSGGSQNGAFGAGFLDQWAELRTQADKPGNLPRFRVITGISTGALQSTFAFLGDTDEIVGQYTITKESELLHPFAKSGLKGGSTIQKAGAALAVIRRGAIAELEPLRTTLRKLIDAELLKAVAREAAAGRFLLVGAVEMDTGDAYVFDLTKAATSFVAGDATMRDCYIEALMASSSVPLAALPVFIDGKMYIDGGARFGVLSDYSGALLEAAALIPAQTKKNLFIIVNGTLEAGTVCHLRDCEGAPLPETPAGTVPQHAKWSFDGLAFRSMSILINQSYRASVYWATDQAKERGFAPHFVRIDSESLNAHQAVVGIGPEADTRQSCAYWRKLDKQLDAPLEFHPRFMRCQIDYGRNRREIADWAELE